VILSYYRDRDLTKLIVAVRRADLPDDTPVYYGGYWGKDLHPTKPPPPPPPKPPDGKPPRPRPPMPGRRYAPIFTLTPTEFWKGRDDVTDEQQAILRTAGQGRFRGRVPGRHRLMRMGGRRRYLWGVELGRRWRDRIRVRRAKGQRVTTWQFDEIPNELAARGGYKRRQLIQGALYGVTYGRAPLGDVKLPGLVFITGDALTVARHRGNRSFWRRVDDCAIYLIGEEYPAFTGSPRRAARAHAHWRSWLYHAGGARRSLSDKYVVGMTPGYRPDPGLGGNLLHRGLGKVRSWRLGYVRTRARTGPAGLAQYNFTYRNASWRIVRDVMLALAKGVRIARRH
jgi:hypothetical protein